jgi:hypothetical protein
MINLETGSGKTALCLTIACHYATTGLKVVIINDSDDLTFRDFKKAEGHCLELGVDINFIKDCTFANTIKAGVTFMSFKTIESLSKVPSILDMQSTVVICDEFDSLIFGSDENARLAHLFLPQTNYFLGFTGSNLREFHVKAALQALEGNIIKMNVTDYLKPTPVCHGVDVYTKLSDYRDAIAILSSQHAQKTPVVIIAEDKGSNLAKKI